MSAAAAVHDGLNWRAYAVIEKFSPDQAAWADNRIASSAGFFASPRMRKSVRLGGSRYRSLLAATLRLCGAPEDGIREEPGNLLVTVGLSAITSLLLGNGGQALGTSGTSNKYGICGVGTGTTSATTSDTALTEDDSADAFYQGFDSSYPTNDDGVMTGQSTFASSNANFAWNEWCWATSTGTYGGTETSTELHYTSGSGLWASDTTQVMWNHKVPGSSLGTKASGAAWVFTTTITLS